MEENRDYIADFVRNKKRQKKITFVTAVVLLALIIAVVFLTRDHLVTQKKLEDYVSIKRANERLERLHVQDSVRLQTLLASLEALKTDNSLKGELQKIKIQQDILQSNTLKSTIYIQYQPGFQQVVQDLRSYLQKSDYTVPAAESISFRFSPGVKYFNAADKETATIIAEQAREVTKISYQVQYVNLAAPKGQIEIWVSKN